MDELEVTNCPHCGAKIYGAGSLSASGKYCKHCIKCIEKNYMFDYVEKEQKQSNVITNAIVGRCAYTSLYIFRDSAESIYESLKEHDYDMLRDFVRFYIDEHYSEYISWLMEEF